MRGQSSFILALIFALIVAIFSVINVESVRVNYLFGEAYVPLILVILVSTLLGGMIVGAVGIFRQVSLTLENRALRKKLSNFENVKEIENEEESLVLLEESDSEKTDDEKDQE